MICKGSLVTLWLLVQWLDQCVHKHQIHPISIAVNIFWYWRWRWYLGIKCSSLRWTLQLIWSRNCWILTRRLIFRRSTSTLSSRQHGAGEFPHCRKCKWACGCQPARIYSVCGPSWWICLRPSEEDLTRDSAATCQSAYRPVCVFSPAGGVHADDGGGEIFLSLAERQTRPQPRCCLSR